MGTKGITPISFIVTALEQYVKAHSQGQVTLAQTIQNCRFDELRAKASGFALKEFATINLKESNLSYAVSDDGALEFYKHRQKVCTIESEVTKSISLSCDGCKTKVYRNLILTLDRINDDADTRLYRVYAINLLFCLSRIGEGIKKAGLSSKTEHEQIAIIA
jgi:hypothetical protein